MKVIRGIIFTILLSQLGACAVMSESECLSANWHKVGYDIGMDGNREISEAFNKREQVCAKYGARADWQDFQAGHAEGIDRYCDVTNAVKLGTRGKRYAMTNNICPEVQYPGFTRAFSDGFEYYRLKQYVDEAAYELSCLEDEVYQYRHERRDLKSKIKSGELEAYARNNADNRRKHLRRVIRSLQYEINGWRSRVNIRQREADRHAEYLRTEYPEDLYEAVLN